MEMQSAAGHGPTTTTEAAATTAATQATTTTAAESAEAAAATESATFTFTARDFHCRVAEISSQHELWQPFINCEATQGSNSSNYNNNNNSTLTTTFQCTLQAFDRHEQKALYACNDTELGELAMEASSAFPFSSSSSFTSCTLETHVLRPPHEAYAQFQLAVSDNVSDTLSFSANRCNGQVLLCEQAEQEADSPSYGESLLCQLQQQQELPPTASATTATTLLDYHIELGSDSGSLWSWLNLTELVDTVSVMSNESVSNATATAISSSSGSLDMILSNYTLSGTALTTTTTMATATDIVISRNIFDYTPHGYDWLFLFVVFFIFAGGLGNILVCLAVALDRKLQNVTNYFLFSLAIADLLVSLFVMPMGAIPAFLGKYT